VIVSRSTAKIVGRSIASPLRMRRREPYQFVSVSVFSSRPHRSDQLLTHASAVVIDRVRNGISRTSDALCSRSRQALFSNTLKLPLLLQLGSTFPYKICSRCPITSVGIELKLEEAGNHKSAKTHAGKTQRPAASGRGEVTQGKLRVINLLMRRGITAGKTQHTAAAILRCV